MVRTGSGVQIPEMAPIHPRAGLLKRSTRADCKSAGFAFGGSNPPPCTIIISFTELSIMSDRFRRHNRDRLSTGPGASVTSLAQWRRDHDPARAWRREWLQHEAEATKRMLDSGVLPASSSSRDTMRTTYWLKNLMGEQLAVGDRSRATLLNTSDISDFFFTNRAIAEVMRFFRLDGSSDEMTQEVIPIPDVDERRVSTVPLLEEQLMVLSNCTPPHRKLELPSPAEVVQLHDLRQGNQITLAVEIH
jgi:hypothetical protein